MPIQGLDRAEGGGQSGTGNAAIQQTDADSELAGDGAIDGGGAQLTRQHPVKHAGGSTALNVSELGHTQLESETITMSREMRGQ
jgi:hypothetical protein